MQKDIEDLNELVFKIKRLEIALSSKIDQFTESEKAIADYKKELTLEIEELKSLQKSLPKLMASTLKESSAQELPKILPQLIKGFKEKTLDLVEKSTEEAERLKTQVNQTIHNAQQAISSEKKQITLRSIGMAAVICVSTLLTSLSIFYFFPQHQHVHFGLNSETGRILTYGIAFVEHAKEINPKDRDLIINKAIQKQKNIDF